MRPFVIDSGTDLSEKDAVIVRDSIGGSHSSYMPEWCKKIIFKGYNPRKKCKNKTRN